MAFQIYFEPKALDGLSRIDKQIARQINNKLNWLANRLSDTKIKRLRGSFKKSYSLRIGNYRAIYIIDYATELIIVRLINHRSRSYRQK